MTYIIKTDNNISFYYYRAGKILTRKRSAEGLSDENTIIENVRSDFTLSLSDREEVYIFCRDNVGNVIMVKSGSEGYIKRTILENKANSGGSAIYFDAKISEASIDLIYNVPKGGKGNNDIYFQSLGKQKNAPLKMDSVFAIRNDVYRVCTIGDIRVAAYFQNDRRLSLCYREIMGQSVGPLNTVFSSGGAFTDYAIMGNREGIYFAAVQTNVFSSRLLFRKRTSSGFSEVSSAADMNMINSPLIFLAGDKVNIFFRSGSRSYITAEGERPKPFIGKICERLTRAVYIDLSSLSHIKASEALVNAERP